MLLDEPWEYPILSEVVAVSLDGWITVTLGRALCCFCVLRGGRRWRMHQLLALRTVSMQRDRQKNWLLKLIHYRVYASVHQDLEQYKNGPRTALNVSVV